MFNFRQTAAMAALLCLSATPTALAASVTKSAPVALPTTSTIPVAADVPWPGGTMRLDIDASNVAQRFFTVQQTIPLPAKMDKIILRLPEWLPGNHAPRGEIEKIAGLRITVDGKSVAWVRDPVDVYSFHINLPRGAKTLVANFQFLSATKDNQGRIVYTDKMMNLQWEDVALYPAGHYVRQIPVQANVTWPAGWTAYTSLRGTVTGNTSRYTATDFETLIDSPVFAGKYARAVPLSDRVTLNMVADSAEELVASDEQIGAHKRLVEEAVALFGTQQYDHYDFLLAITDEMGSIGLEHHRSSENGVDTGYFTKWNDGPGERNLLPHEMVHSWNGKYRRPERIWQPDYATPMQDDLLWVYEGQTQFWGYVLGARSGLYSKEQSLDALASIAARLDTAKGREWRPMVDTTHDPIISARRPKGWTSWQRSEDYYNEGLMIWLEADAVIRAGTKGAKGMDDFARSFFGGRDGDWGVVTYNRADIVKALNAVYAYDWNEFLNERVDQPTREVTKGGFTRAGYSLAYGDTPNSTTKTIEKLLKGLDQSYGIGLVVRDTGEVASVIWNGPAFTAGMAVGNQIIAVNGVEYSKTGFVDAIKAAKDGKAPIELIVKQERAFRSLRLDYSGGIRYPRLQKTGEGETSLDRLLTPRVR